MDDEAPYSRELIKKVLLEGLEKRGADDLFEEVAAILVIYFHQTRRCKQLLEEFDRAKWKDT